jgi:hypothetical protein
LVPGLDDAWTRRSGVCEQCREVEVVGEHHVLVVPGPAHDVGVVCLRVAKVGPVNGLEACGLELRAAVMSSASRYG